MPGRSGSPIGTATGWTEADLTVTHTGEERVTTSVEACLAEAEPRSSTLLVEQIGMCGIVDIQRVEEEPAG